MLFANSTPHPNYYVDNLCKLLNQALTQYEDLLNDDELQLADSILNLSNDAIRLFARLLSRKGPLFFVDELQYSEVTDCRAALDEMQRVQLIQFFVELPSALLLATLTKSKIADAFMLNGLSASKAALIAKVQEQHTDDSILIILKEHYCWFELTVKEELERFSLLFFGDRYHDLSAFVVRDLGIVRFEKYTLDKQARQFTTRGELDLYLEWSTWKTEIIEEDEKVSRKDFEHYIDQLAVPHPHRFLERLRSKLLNLIGRELERSHEYDSAIRAYKLSSLPPCRERLARIHHKRKHEGDCEQVLNSIHNDPWDKEEAMFAGRFPRRTSQKPAYQKHSLTVKQGSFDSPEQAVINYFEQQGCQAWHFENSLPMMLFGLTYWDWIYVSVPGAFTNRFQIGPRDLYWSEFFDVRRQICESPLETSTQLLERIRQTAKSKWGIANPFVIWNNFSPELLETVIVSLGSQQIQAILQIVSSDLRQFRAGFPDLWVLRGDGSSEFVEVKTVRDRVQDNQHLWLEELVNSSLQAYVLRLVDES